MTRLFASRNEPELRRSCDSLYQIVEFTDKDAVTSIEKFFGDEGEEMAASLIVKVGSDSLHDLVTNPSPPRSSALFSMKRAVNFRRARPSCTKINYMLSFLGKRQ